MSNSFYHMSAIFRAVYAKEVEVLADAFMDAVERYVDNEERGIPNNDIFIRKSTEHMTSLTPFPSREVADAVTEPGIEFWSGIFMYAVEQERQRRREYERREQAL